MDQASATPGARPLDCLSYLTYSLWGMSKFDREGFQMMMAELNTEEISGVVVRSPYEDMEPDPEYLPQKT